MRATVKNLGALMTGCFVQYFLFYCGVFYIRILDQLLSKLFKSKSYINNGLPAISTKTSDFKDECQPD
jgi:uncharacterized membrane protein YcfT